MTNRFNLYISIITILLSAIFVTGQLPAATINYCHDEEVNKDWERIANSYNEPEIKELYRLRKDLCAKVDLGEITLDEAIDTFETQRQLKIKTLKQRKQRMQSAPSPPG